MRELSFNDGTKIFKKTTEEKLLQVVNLSPDEQWIDKIVEVHPMKQVAIMSVVQVGVFGFMLFIFWIIQLVIDSGVKII